MARPVPQIITHLKTKTAITDLVDDRIYADNPPQDTAYPFILLTNESGSAWGSVNNHQVKAYVMRLNVMMVSENNRGQSEVLQELVEDSIIEYKSATTDATHPIAGTTVDGSFDWGSTARKDGTDSHDYWCEQNFLVHYKRLI